MLFFFLVLFLQEGYCYSCYGLPSTHFEVCSTHGTCVSTDTCDCDLGYNGDNCGYLDSCFDEDVPLQYYFPMKAPDCYEGFLDGISGILLGGPGPFTCGSEQSLLTPSALIYFSHSLFPSEDTSLEFGFYFEADGSSPESTTFSASFSGLSIRIIINTFSGLINISSSSLGITPPISLLYPSGGVFIKVRIDDTFLFFESVDEIGDTSSITPVSHSYGPLGISSFSLSFNTDSSDTLYLSNFYIHSSNRPNITNPTIIAPPTAVTYKIADLRAVVETIYYTCFGLQCNQNLVCSGHGICTSTNNCACYPNYFGEECDILTCFGILSNETVVCSGHGTCTSPDTCDCDSGYGGNDCELFICNGILQTNPGTCNSHGSCTGPDTCDCNSGYTGSDCEFITCDGLPLHDPNVCSGHGNCVTPDTCDCEETFGGTECEVDTKDPQYWKVGESFFVT